MRSPSDPAARVNRSRVAETCGECHVGILEKYRESIHGRIPRGTPEKNSNGKEPATCSDCHRPHHVTRPDAAFRTSTVETCTGCHDKRGETYRGTFHGRMTQLGNDEVATCSDCHTAHSMLPAGDPASSVHPANRTATCARCHEGATEVFASYAVRKNTEVRLDYIHERWRSDDWSWYFADRTTPFTYGATTDGTQVIDPKRQTADFVGVRFIHRFF